MNFFENPLRRRNVRILFKLLAVFVGLVLFYSVSFHYLMAYEGQEFSWITGIYWTLVVMSTLGFGDITFESDAGRAFSVVVLLSGTVFMLVLLPFMFIQFFYVPWLESQMAARAPRRLPEETKGHVVLTSLGPIEGALVRILQRAHLPYVLVAADLNQALKYHDEGYRVMVGDLDDPETYRLARVGNAALVAATMGDTTNTNVAFTVREISETAPIVTTASSAASVDILELAGSNHVLQLGEMLGQALARRVLGRDARSHVIGQFGPMQIAEAAAAGTPFVGRTLRDIRLRDIANVNVVGVWDRGRFQIAGPETEIRGTSVFVLAGSQDQLNHYNELLCIYNVSEAPVVIIGGGRVGRAVGKALAADGIDYRIIEKAAERIKDPEKYVLGDAADIEILRRAGIDESSSVVITTRDDDMNVYLTIYCRRLRPDIQILVRAHLERNISTLHRAGADFVLSYATTGANVIYNLIKKSSILLLAEGLDVFQVPTPEIMAGRSLSECAIRQATGCNVIAVVRGEDYEINPDAQKPLPADSQLVVIGDIESENRFMETYFEV